MNVLFDPETLSSVFTLEPWKTTLAFVLALLLQLDLMEEIVVGVLQALHGELERLASCFREKCVFPFERRQLCLIHPTAQRLFLGLVGVDTLGKVVVEDKPTASEVLVEKHLLLLAWVQPKLVSVEAVHLPPCFTRFNNRSALSMNGIKVSGL